MLEAFGATGTPVALPGGQGSSVRAGDVVLKPVEDVREARWCAQLLDRVVEDGFRVARPVRARDGAWTAGGWAAYGLVEGRTGAAGHWPQLYAAGRAFCRAVAREPRPALLARRTSRWALADRVAWAEAAVAAPPEVAPLLARLQQGLGALAPLRSQLVHGDLAGNVLFAPGLPPALIDLAPYWRPVAFAEAVAVVDGALGPEAGRRLPLEGTEGMTQDLLVRALVFRVTTLGERARTHPAVLAELPRHEEVAALVAALG